MKISIASGVICALIFAAAGLAEPASTPADQQVAAVPALPQRGTTDAIERGKAAIARACDLYTNLKSYRDRSVVRKYQNYTDRDYTAVVECEFVCDRPGKFRVDFTRSPSYGQLTMVSDGKRYQRSVQESEVYTDDEAPELTAPIVFKNDIVAENVPAHFYLISRGIPAPKLLLRTPREVIDSREEVLDGRKGLRVICLAVSEQEPEKPDAKADIVHEFWFDGQAGAIGEMVRDSTFRTRENDKERQPDRPTGDAPHVATRIATVTRIFDVQIDKPVAAETFTLNPQSQWKKVPEFITQSGMDMGQYRTIGLPAPEFKLMDLQGKQVALSDFAGRVVVLDFWATWCGPCVSAMPHLQKLQEEFKDQPVTILGMNSDYALSDEKLAAWMAKRQFTFGTLRLIEGSSTFKDFGVGGIPHTVLIDKNGVVQDVTVGFMGEEHGEILKARIAKLLAGESLKTPEEFKSLREQGMKRSEPNVTYVRSLGELLPVEEVNSQRIASWSKVTKGIVPYTARAVQLPDGSVGVMSPISKQEIGGFLLYEVAGDKVTSFIAEGAKGTPFAWTTIRDGGLKVVGLFQDYDRRSYAQLASDLACWDLSGKKLWSFDLGLPAQIAGEIKLESADLDGDGRPEIVALICVNEVTTRGQGRTSNGKTLGKICILSADGKLLAAKQLPLFTNTSLSIFPQSNEAPVIVAFGGGKVWKLSYNSKAGQLSEADSKGVGNREPERAKTTSADPSHP